MKIVISADMEGTSGVVNWVQVTPPEQSRAGQATSSVEYERARSRMTQEVNAAVEGAIAAGADEVIVNDSHDGMKNLIPEDLHSSVRFVAGFDKELLMAQGVEEENVGAIFFTGYHARAGTPDGPLAHSFTGWLQDVRVNGRSMGEYGINALVAGHFNVPVALVTGDNRAVEQTRELLGEHVVGISVKTGYSETSAVNLHPTLARERIREGAERAVRALDDMQVYRLEEDSTIEIDLDHQSRATQAAYIPNIQRSDWRTLTFQVNNGLELAHYMRAVITAAGAGR